MKPNIALLTDFGHKGSHYIASMKGVILKINPNVNIIDISHNISSYSIIEASYILKSTYEYFEKGTVFVIVVDPGVGSSREILGLKTESGYYFVGPNNGIFSNIFRNDKIIECILIENDKFFNKPVSNTFHGRDIMAPISAHITNGESLIHFGPAFALKNLITYPIKYEILSDNAIHCIIQYIDSFGNGITNIPVENNIIKTTNISLKNRMNIKISYANKTIECQFSPYFDDVPKGSYLLTNGSSNYLEICKNQGNAAKDIGFNVGDELKITFADR